MAESEAYRKGAEIRRQLLGDAFVERAARTTYSDPIMRKFIDVATETVFGALWSRPGLDLKTRTLACVVSDAATGRFPELAIHIRMALRQGWTQDELIEVLLHISGYVGLPIIREALLTAKEVFAEAGTGGASEKPAAGSGGPAPGQSGGLRGGRRGAEAAPAGPGRGRARSRR